MAMLICHHGFRRYHQRGHSQMQAIVREKIDRLQQLNDDVLRALPEYSEDIAEIDGKKVIVGTYLDVLADGVR